MLILDLIGVFTFSETRKGKVGSSWKKGEIIRDNSQSCRGAINCKRKEGDPSVCLSRYVGLLTELRDTELYDPITISEKQVGGNWQGKRNLALYITHPPV